MQIHYQELDHFLTTHGAFPIIKLQGFLVAIISGPSMIIPSQWLNVAGINNIEFEDLTQANIMLGTVMQLYNNICTQLHQATFIPLINLPEQSEQVEISDQLITKAKLWVNGYLQGIFMHSTWSNFIQKEFYSEEFNDLEVLSIPILSLVMSDQELTEFLTEEQLLSCSECRKLSVKSLSTSAIQIYRFWLNRREDLIKPSSNKVKRNEACYCGSGKKYKKCCLQ